MSEMDPSSQQADMPAGEGPEAVEAQAPAELAGQAAVPQASPGALLRAAREAAGVDRPALALALKVSVRKLEALEDDQFDQLPDLVFVRALASSVCRTLKIDARDILALLPQTHAPRLQNDDSGLNTPFRTPSDIARTPLMDRLSRPMVMAAMAILLGALVLIFFPTAHESSPGSVTEAVPNSAPKPAADAAAQEAPGMPPVVAEADKPAPAGGTATAAAPAVASAPVAVPLAAPLAAPPAAPVAANAALARASAPGQVPVPVPVPFAARTPTTQSAPAPAPLPATMAARPVAAAAPATPAAQAGTPAAAAPVSASMRQMAFKARGPSWVEVLDASGSVLISRLVAAGETASVTGVAPLRVTVGRTDLTEVSYQGKPFDLSPYAKQGVARFEVKP